MLKPLDYENVQANSNYTPLEKGGYIYRIMVVEEATTQNGALMFNVSLDIAEGPETGRFAKEYREDTRNPKKWGCVYRQGITAKDGGTNPFFKGLITAIEESNGMTVNWTEDPNAFAAQFKGKLVGGKPRLAARDERGGKHKSCESQRRYFYNNIFLFSTFFYDINNCFDSNVHT